MKRGMKAIPKATEWEPTFWDGVQRYASERELLRRLRERCEALGSVDAIRAEASAHKERWPIAAKAV